MTRRALVALLSLSCLAAPAAWAAPVVDNTIAHFSSASWRGHSVSVSERGTLRIGDRFFASPYNKRFRTLSLSDGRHDMQLVGNDPQYSKQYGRQNARTVAAWFQYGGHHAVAQAMNALLDGNKALAVHAELVGKNPLLIFALSRGRKLGLLVEPRELHGRQQLLLRYGALGRDGVPTRFVVLRNEPHPEKTARLAAPPQLRRNARKVRYLLGELHKALSADLDAQ